MHSNLFRLALERGQWERAQVHLEVCQASMFSLQDRVRALSAAGRLWFCKGALEKAREAHEEELKIAVSSMLKEDAADAYSDLAKVLLAEGKPKEAWRKALEAMRLYGRMKSKLNQGVVFRLLAEIYAQLGRPLRAERTIRTSIDILRKVGASVEVAKSYLCGSRLPGEGVNLEEQAAWLKEACAIFKKVALGPMMVQGYLALTRLEMRRRSLDSAVENLHCASEALGGLDDPEALRRDLEKVTAELEGAMVTASVEEVNEFTALREVSQALRGREAIESRLREALELLKRVARVDRGALFLLEPRTRRAEVEIAFNLEKGALPALRRFVQNRSPGLSGPLLSLTRGISPDIETGGEWIPVPRF